MPTQNLFEKDLIQAVQLASRRLASRGSFHDLLYEVLSICVDAVGASGGTIYIHEPPHTLRFQHVIPESVRHLLPSSEIPDDFGAAGQAFQERQTVVREFASKPKEDWNTFEQATGVQVRTMIATPLMMENEDPIGVVQLLNKNDGPFTDQDAAVLDTISAVSTLAYHNFKLTEESNRASTLLGMGKVSHDIGNLAASLHAGLSFVEMSISDVKECVETGQIDPAMVAQIDPMIFDLKLSVDRIVGYARLVSDMSAGRKVRPVFNAVSLAETVARSGSYLESQARSSEIELAYDIQQDAPEFPHDELFVFRIVQNLVGNAIKAVTEFPSAWKSDHGEFQGRVVLAYAFKEGRHCISVTDSGPGMKQEMVNRILSGNARSQWENAGGSGWGMKIVLELTAALGGKLCIESEVGKGTTFVVELG